MSAASSSRRGQKVVKGEVIGEPPEISYVSYWVSGLASPFVPWGKRAMAYLDAVRSGDREKMQTAVNAGFGELYAAGGGEAPAWTEVLKLQQPYVMRSNLPGQQRRDGEL